MKQQKKLWFCTFYPLYFQVANGNKKASGKKVGSIPQI
jgi:hypothetical protein